MRQFQHNNATTDSSKLVKSIEEIKLIERSCRIVADTLSMLGKYVKPGIETLELDKIAEDYIKSKDAKPAFKGYEVDSKFFPYTLCISVNEEVVHGMPSRRKLIEGEIVSLDCGVVKDGYYGDSAVTYGVGTINQEKQRLMKITEQSLYLGIEMAIDGNKVYDVSRTIQEFCEENGYSLTRELVGHGIGKDLHEEPAIPNFVPPLLHRNKFPNLKLKAGITMAIEPMVHMGRKETFVGKDGWTVITSDRRPAAHFEHTIVVENLRPIILTLRN